MSHLDSSPRNMCQNVHFEGGKTISPFRDKMFTGQIVTGEKCHCGHFKWV